MFTLWSSRPSFGPPPYGNRDLGNEELLQARILGSAGGQTSGGKIHLEVINGSLRGKLIVVEQAPEGAMSAAIEYRPGDRVIVSYLPGAPERKIAPFVIVDFARHLPLIFLGVIFVALLALVAGWQGLRSLVGMLCALGILVWFVVPHILAGREPLLITIMGCGLIVAIVLPVTQTELSQVLASGLGLLGGVFVAGGLSVIFVSAAQITGLASSEELLLVEAATNGVVNVQGLLLAGMLIGAIGALVDAALGQASSVFELHAADYELSLWSLYQRGMNVGRVHIGAMVNTLVLAYAGASLPIIFLLTLYQGHTGDFWNREDIAVEIVRSLVGSLGILVAVPLTTLASAAICRFKFSSTLGSVNSPPFEALHRRRTQCAARQKGSQKTGAVGESSEQ